MSQGLIIVNKPERDDEPQNIMFSNRPAMKLISPILKDSESCEQDDVLTAKNFVRLKQKD